MLNPKTQRQLAKVLRHLYINPLEKCNLKCKICYTRKTDPILSNKAILDFINRYRSVHELDTVTFCGGEVFALQSFPDLVNTVTQDSLFVQVITNGTLDQLEALARPNDINLIVSLDGLEQYHDSNRGTGNFAKSITFMQKAHKLGFHLEVFSILTQQNLSFADKFEAKLHDLLGFSPRVTYHPRKPPTYLTHHPVSSIVGQVAQFDFLLPEQMVSVMQERVVFPPKELGCYQIAVASDGRVYGCCEGTVPLGKMSDPPAELIAALRERLEQWESQTTFTGCLGCSQSEFMCGIKQYLETLYAS